MPSEIDSPRENSSILITNDSRSILTQDGYLGNNKLPADYHFVPLIILVIIASSGCKQNNVSCDGSERKIDDDDEVRECARASKHLQIMDMFFVTDNQWTIIRTKSLKLLSVHSQ